MTRAHPTQSNSIRRNIGIVIATLLMLISGLYFIVQQIPDVITGLQTQSWTLTTATVLESRWLTHHDTGDEYNTDYVGKGYTHTPEITYSYIVNGRTFTSRRYQAGNTARPSVDEIKSTVARYPVGRVVRVSYNPSNPAQSVLAPGVNGSSWFMLMIGLGMLASGISFWRGLGWHHWVPDL
jgi:Protein of unknown function (DUF3592)